VKRGLGIIAALVLTSAVPTATAAPGPQGTETVIDVRNQRQTGNSFEAVWAAYRKAESSGDTDTAAKVFSEIRRLRIERNIPSLEHVSLALVARGIDRLRKGDASGAEDEFRKAISLDPHLPDGYLGLARRELKKGPLGILPALRQSLAGVTARFSTTVGRQDLLVLLVSAMLLALLATTAVLAGALLLRYGPLLRHDLEERFGPGKRALALGVYGILVLLPTATFQGYGWLPLWWLALVFVYANTIERAVSVAALIATLIVGPLTGLLEPRLLESQNPLFRASLLAVEGGPDRRAIADLEAASRRFGDDVDLTYLLALQYKKSGDYDQAAALYRELLRTRGDKDPIALNNLANLEFTRGEFAAAITRYKQASELAARPEVQATAYYNLSLAYYQKFERQRADEARAQADGLAGSLLRQYDREWKYESNENAVVDLGLTPEQIRAKYDGAREGVAQRNVAGQAVAGQGFGALGVRLFNRFLGVAAVFFLVVVIIGRWRGSRTFTMRCTKCGTPFCKQCHLGAAPGGLCTQCFHLFIVRDGVSGPARNQKLVEVQREEERRERVFRILSLLSPGAGHIYVRKTLMGVAFAAVWYGLLALALLAGQMVPVTHAAGFLVGPWGLVLAVVLLLVTYVAANRARPGVEGSLPIPRGPRRGRAA
jgi:tetratricopeptide (TPR) repeat protein